MAKDSSPSFCSTQVSNGDGKHLKIRPRKSLTAGLSQATALLPVTCTCVGCHIFTGTPETLRWVVSIHQALEITGNERNVYSPWLPRPPTAPSPSPPPPHPCNCHITTIFSHLSLFPAFPHLVSDLKCNL